MDDKNGSEDKRIALQTKRAEIGRTTEATERGALRDADDDGADALADGSQVVGGT